MLINSRSRLVSCFDFENLRRINNNTQNLVYHRTILPIYPYYVLYDSGLVSSLQVQVTVLILGVPGLELEEAVNVQDTNLELSKAI